MERLEYGIKNSRIWYLCSLPRETENATLDNWTRYSGAFIDMYYLNNHTQFLKVNHYEKTFTFISNVIRKTNEEDFRAYFSKYLNYMELK